MLVCVQSTEKREREREREKGKTKLWVLVRIFGLFGGYFAKECTKEVVVFPN
jgi:hypothetical protein